MYAPNITSKNFSIGDTEIKTETVKKVKVENEAVGGVEGSVTTD